MLELLTWEYAGIEPAAIPIPAGKMFPIPARRISAMFKFDIDARIRLLYHGFQMSEKARQKVGTFSVPSFLALHENGTVRFLALNQIWGRKAYPNQGSRLFAYPIRPRTLAGGVFKRGPDAFV